MAYQASIEDWLSLLDISSEVRGAFAGIVPLKTATDALSAARTRWPGVNQDYVAVVDAVTEQVEKLQDVLVAQQQFLDDLRRTIESIYASLPNHILIRAEIDDIPAPAGRLLTAEERAQLEQIPEQLDTLFEEVERWTKRLEREAEEAESAADDAAADAESAAEQAEEDEEDEEDEGAVGGTEWTYEWRPK